MRIKGNKKGLVWKTKGTFLTPFRGASFLFLVSSLSACFHFHGFSFSTFILSSCFSPSLGCLSLPDGCFYRPRSRRWEPEPGSCLSRHQRNPRIHKGMRGDRRKYRPKPFWQGLRVLNDSPQAVFWLLDGQTGHHYWKSSFLHLLGEGWFQSGIGKHISMPAGLHLEVIISVLLDEGVLKRLDEALKR